MAGLDIGNHNGSLDRLFSKEYRAIQEIPTVSFDNRWRRFCFGWFER